ncbi:hypothetical protein [Burkholderia pyrrocinia]|uniref:hypothetical protein n=1 Tax=Burkholderia pyrrocinia TaxID=60550 RepID=UPI00104CD532|nr:hypothetical protein [Burkholderia pyrrocinia]TDA48285.1 hypothetical protein EVG18_06310 [Burkholderia pyrrocinia]
MEIPSLWNENSLNKINNEIMSNLFHTLCRDTASDFELALAKRDGPGGWAQALNVLRRAESEAASLLERGVTSQDVVTLRHYLKSIQVTIASLEEFRATQEAAE